MFAPGSGPTEEKGIVKNKNAKQITFVRKKGRISLKMGSKDVGGERLLSERIQEMKDEVKQAEAGRTETTMKDLGAGGYEYKRHGIKSTFPGWFSKLGFNSKKDFTLG